MPQAFEIISTAEIEVRYAFVAKAKGYIADRIRNDPKFPKPWRCYGAPIALWSFRADEVAAYFAVLSDRGHAKRAARREARAYAKLGRSLGMATAIPKT